MEAIDHINVKDYHGVCHPMTDLENYKGKEILSIDMIVKNENDELSIESFYNDEIFFINDQGHLEYSSYENGCMDYDEELKKYVLMRHFVPTEYDFVGFSNITLSND